MRPRKELEMNGTKHGLLRAGVFFVAVSIMGSQGKAVESAPTHDHNRHRTVQAQTAGERPAVASLQDIYAKQLPGVQDAIRKAIEHLEAGHAQAALAELRKAQGALQAVHKALGLHIGPQFVNARCPIMGSPINADKVNADLIRTYQGKKVAFCCAGCPIDWDRLSDAQKTAKLKLATDEGCTGPASTNPERIRQ
jgi:hypothetical protein